MAFSKSSGVATTAGKKQVFDVIKAVGLLLAAPFLALLALSLWSGSSRDFAEGIRDARNGRRPRQKRFLESLEGRSHEAYVHGYIHHIKRRKDHGKLA